MTDKILKLAAKSGLYVEAGEIYQNNDDYYALSFPLTEYMDKFAELIIQECIGDFEKKIKIRYAGDQKSIDVGYGMELVIDSIKQNFGIV